MGAVEDHISESVREANAKALHRWEIRSAVREAGLLRISQSGLGAADPAGQVFAHARREAARVSIRFQERIVGPTIDFSTLAPGTQAAQAATPVARLVRLPGNGYNPTPLATGFLVAPGLLMTNHHVFPLREDAYLAAANFGYCKDEKGLATGSYFTLDAKRFHYADPELDFALVAVSATGTQGESLEALGFCRLIASTGKILTGMPVNIIQHPDGGPRTYAFTNNRLVDILPEGFLHYETDTLPGSSGSPLFNSEWELLGIHHAGIPKIVQGKIITKDEHVFNEDADSPDSIDWVANEGARVSSIVQRLATVTMPEASQQKLLESLLQTTRDPLIVNSTPFLQVPSSASTGVPMANNYFSMTGPVTINVFAPGATSQALPPETPAVSQLPSLVVESKQTFDPDYGNRTGYNANFLDVNVPLPEVVQTRKDEIYCVQDYADFTRSDRTVQELDLSKLASTDPFILVYHHYSLAFNREFRMCHWTASNIDYSDAARRDTRTRQELGGENWAVDPRVPADLQLKDKDIYGPGKRIDRGHIVRREDNCWGAQGEETAFANADSYHWTNCTPQHEAFNQENPRDNLTKQPIYAGVKGIWGELESVVQKQIGVNGGQATVFAGPVLNESVMTVEVGGQKISVPTLFWKVIVVPESKARNPKLQSFGYVLSQKDVVKKFGLQIEEAFQVPPKFERMQKSIVEIGELAGIEFPSIVVAVDQMGRE